MLLIIFLLILIFNIAPAFTPPTWLVLCYIGVVYQPNRLLLALLGAIAATCGRLILAKLSTIIIRNRWLSAASQQNIDLLKEQLSRRRKLTAGIFLLYAFGPLPSNQLFIAYGLTKLELRLIALPFFFGRLVSYAGWIFMTSKVSQQADADSFQNRGFFSWYFIITQIITLLIVYLLTKIDWHKFVTEKKLRFISTGSETGRSINHCQADLAEKKSPPGD